MKNRRGWFDISDKRKPVKVLVIDSGIDTSVAGLDSCVIKSTGFDINDRGYITEYHGLKARHPHGTVVSRIIRYICSNVEFISINILDEKLATDGRVLLYAMSKAFDYMPDIIHMSLGTTRWRYRRYIKRVVKEANSNNVVLVAAADNQGRISYPAYAKGVIGVKAGCFSDPLQFEFLNRFFYAPDNAFCIFEMQEEELKKAKGTSISAAFITGHAANLKSRYPGITNNQIMEMLISESIKSKEW